MGCDIHVFREVKKDGKWECLDSSYEENEGTDAEPDMRTYLDGPHIPRNYWLFGVLSNGVRTEWPFAFEAQGLHDDVSAPIQEESDRWDIDGHSHSWRTIEELQLKAAELVILPNPHANQCASYLRDVLSRLEWPEGVPPNDCRVVFWFDN